MLKHADEQQASLSVKHKEQQQQQQPLPMLSWPLWLSAV
jgi:hypothetical protein